jgi:Tol biopolymer transport system component
MQSRKTLLVMSLLFSVFVFLSITPSRATQKNSGKIVFGSDRFGDERIYVMNADGSDQTLLTNGQGHYKLPV